jgi:hypothetical protein
MGTQFQCSVQIKARSNIDLIANHFDFLFQVAYFDSDSNISVQWKRKEGVVGEYYLYSMIHQRYIREATKKHMETVRKNIADAIFLGDATQIMISYALFETVIRGEIKQ